MQKLKLNDEVVIIAGKDKGKTGKVEWLDIEKSKVIVGGVNLQKKAIKPNQENPQGGISEKSCPVHLSNVSVLSPKTKKPTRVRIEKRDGKNVRISVKCGSVLN